MGEQPSAAPARLILASGSASRRHMLASAGVAFEVVPSSVDEAAVKGELVAAASRRPDPLGLAEQIAVRLAAAKALEVSRRHLDALVIGADQTLALCPAGSADAHGAPFDKPADIGAARDQLREMRGRTHVLVSAVALATGGEVVWDDADQARLTMRAFSDAFLDDYLARAGVEVCSSVGAYQLEGLGIQLFERIDGDYFTILGLPLVPLLAELRDRGVLAP